MHERMIAFAFVVEAGEGRSRTFHNSDGALSSRVTPTRSSCLKGAVTALIQDTAARHQGRLLPGRILGQSGSRRSSVLGAIAELHWLPDVEPWCVVRSTGTALFYWAKPPYTEWSEVVDLGVRCDAPVMCSVGGKVYLAGRVATGTGDSGTTGLYHLTRGKAKLLLSLPPGGDAAYAGLASPEPGKLVMSTYPDQAYFSDAVKPRHFPEYLYKRSDCDIYVAEIEVRD